MPFRRDASSDRRGISGGKGGGIIPRSIISLGFTAG